MKRLKNEVTLGQRCVVDGCNKDLQCVYGFLVPISLGSPLLTLSLTTWLALASGRIANVIWTCLHIGACPLLLQMGLPLLSAGWWGTYDPFVLTTPDNCRSSSEHMSEASLDHPAASWPATWPQKHEQAQPGAAPSQPDSRATIKCYCLKPSRFRWWVMLQRPIHAN